jgi:hypothetical protein
MKNEVETDQPGKVVPGELDDMDEYDIAAVNGDGYDAGDPREWPEEVRAAARKNWADGPEAFDEWVSTFE